MADIVSLLDLGLTVFGFGFTLWRVHESAKASELAQKAAEDARGQIMQLNAIQELNDAIRSLEDIRCIAFELGAALDRYTSN